MKNTELEKVKGSEKLITENWRLTNEIMNIKELIVKLQQFRKFEYETCR